MDPLLISIAAFVGVFALIAGVMFVMKDFSPTTVEDRLSQMTGQKDEAGATKTELVREGVDGLSGMISGYFERFGNLSLMFEQADAPISIPQFFAISGLAGVMSVALGMIAQCPIPLLPLCALTGAFLPLGWIMFRRKGRFKRFAKQLPDALELVARALRSGHSLSAGLHVVVEEMPAPISEEFAKAYEEQNLGVPIEKALKGMLARMPNLDLKFFVTAVAIQKQAGGDLAEILDKIGHIIRERFKIMGQVQALTGEGRISGIVLMALPIALFIAVYYLNPDYVMLLFTEEKGRKMIAAAAFLQVLGAISIKKIINIKI